MSAFHVRKGFTLTITLIALNVVVYVYTAVLSGNFAEMLSSPQTVWTV